MGLNEYTKDFTRQQKQEFAEKVGSSWGYLSHVISGRRQASASLAIDIERESGGAVTCEEICEGADWEYIRSTQNKENHAA